MSARRKPICEHHSVTQLGDGSIIVTSVITEHRRHKPMDNGNLRALLRKLLGWTPADQFGHVTQQIRKGRTYVIRNGAKESVLFLDSIK